MTHAVAAPLPRIRNHSPALIAEPAVMLRRLAAVAAMAERLPVRSIAEQTIVALVRLDMIHDIRGRAALCAPGMLEQERGPRRSPSAVIAALLRRWPASIRLGLALGTTERT